MHAVGLRMQRHTGSRSCTLRTLGTFTAWPVSKSAPRSLFLLKGAGCAQALQLPADGWQRRDYRHHRGSGSHESQGRGGQGVCV